MIKTREMLFGTDIRLQDGAGGMDLAPDNSGDLAYASGNDNIIQALIMRLKVRRGELAQLGWPDYGSRLHELIGEPNVSRTHIKIMAFARLAIEADPRVEKVTSTQIVSIPGERDMVRLMMDIKVISIQNPINLIYDLNMGSI